MSSSCSSVDLGIDPDFGDPVWPNSNTFVKRLSLDGETKCVQVHAALSLVSGSVRDLLVRYPLFKTSQVLIPASQLVHAVKDLNYDKLGQECVQTFQCIEKLEAAVGNTLRMSISGRSTAAQTSASFSTKVTSTLGRKFNKQSSVVSAVQSNGSASSTPALPNGTLRRNRLQRRHSTFQPKINASVSETDSDYVMKDLLVKSEDGLELAMERTKSWSNYVKILLNYGRSRLALEREHARNLSKLSEQTKASLNTDANNNSLPLVQVFEQLMDRSTEFSNRTDQTIALLNQRFISSLENRQKEHDAKRRKLKNDWTKARKQRDMCADELKRARQNLNTKEGGYLKARDSTIRHVNSVPTSGSVDMSRKLKELEKRRRNEEDALNRKTDAESEVWRLERELDARQRELEQLRAFTIGELCDLIRHCDLTTIASTSHFIKAFTELWAQAPVEYEHLNNVIRKSAPTEEFMSFLQSVQGRSVSSASLLRSNPDELQGSSIAASSSESVPSRRRNALTDDQCAYIAETTSQRRGKKSMARLFDQSLNSIEHSEAAKTHKLSKTKQVVKCSHCDHLVIFDAVKCSVCPMVTHKKCLNKLAITCGSNAQRLNADGNSRRMSIFGVPLKSHLETQHRRVPLILEKCIDELQSRGMTCKGIYRTCGVKSKIEQICVSFEQTGKEADVDLTDVHPMNLASVVKLYLRKLPEPLMTYDLYPEWLDFDTQVDSQQLVGKLRDLCDKLPQQNFDTLRFLLTHLKRVTWFELDNLMTASNLAAVISPSLIWHRASNTGPSTPASFSSTSTVTVNPQSTFINDAHRQTQVVEMLIQFAFDIFEVDKQSDWDEFFAKYSDVTEPKECLDPDTEAKLNYNSKAMLADEDDLDYEEEFEEEIEPTCSSSSVQLPPTPDLIGRYKAESSSDDLERDSGYSSKIPPRAATSLVDRHQVGKQRAFTVTSILVSPQSDRKIILPQKQHSADSEPKPLDSCRHKTLKSGEVTVDIKKDQYFLPSYDRQAGKGLAHQKPPNGFKSESLDRRVESRTRFGDYSAKSRYNNINLNGYRTDASQKKEENTERLCLQNVGVIFTGSDDVSYV